MKNLNLKELLAKFLVIGRKLGRYGVFAFIIVVVGVYGFLVFRINTLVTSDPSDDAVNEKLQGLQRTHIDQATVNKIEQLESENVQVRSLFQHARDNPFHD